MFPLAILIGIYSYGIFALGVAHLLYPISVILLTVAWLISILWWYRREGTGINWRDIDLISFIKKSNVFIRISILLLTIIWMLNFIGTLMPEVSFDALWYHLTIPKIFVENQSFFYIPGGLYYYSLMPKLIDMLYIPAAMLNSSVPAKLIHFSFGILTLIVLYKISRTFLSQQLSFFVLLIFSSNLVVAWLSTTAYIDLGRTFFELMAVYGIILFIKEKKTLWLVESAIMAGLAISTKLIALGSLVILIPVIIYLFRTQIKKGIKISLMYITIALIIPLPYFIFSFLNTGNPVYPVFSNLYLVQLESLTPMRLVTNLWEGFVTGADPVNPIYIISFPLLLIVFRYFSKHERLVVIYSLFSVFIWLVTPSTVIGRYLLPYLPVISLLVGITIKHLKIKTIRNTLIVTGLTIAIISIGYRGIASMRFLGILTGVQSREEYLIEYLNYSFGDFYDTTGFFSKNITDKDKVLVYGIHNLWYADFPFIHESYVMPGDEFNYILAPSNMPLPERFKLWQEVHSDKTVGVTLYSQGGEKWLY